MRRHQNRNVFSVFLKQPVLINGSLRWARLEQVRTGVQLPVREIYLSLTIHPGQLSLAIPPLVGAMSTGQRAVMLCGWGEKASMKWLLFCGR